MPIAPDAKQRLAAAMEARRLELGLRWQDVANKGGISIKALHDARKGTGGISALTRRGIDVGLQWAPGTAQRYLNDEEIPAAVTRDVTIAGPPAIGIDTLSVQAQLSEHDQRLEAEFLDLAAQIKAALEQNPAATGADIFGEGTDLARTWDAKTYRTETRLALMAVLSLDAKEREQQQEGSFSQN